MSTPIEKTETHEELRQVIDALHQVNLTLESLRVTISTLVNVTEDHEKRLRGIERWVSSLTPVISALSFLFGVISTIIIHKFFIV